MQALLNSLAEFVLALSKYVGVIVGLISGWALFELTDWRRRSIQRKAIRQALIVELKASEWTLMVEIVQLSFGSQNAISAVNEFRNVLRKDPKQFLETSGSVEKLQSLDDREIADFLKRIPGKSASTASDRPFPILNAVLASPASGFSTDEMSRLIDLRWQLEILTDKAHWLNKNFELTFTVTDSEQHEIVTANHSKLRVEREKRLVYVLECVRLALKTLEV